MPAISPSARGKFDMLFADVRRALKRIEKSLDEAIDEGDVDTIVRMAQARKEMKDALWDLRDVEMEYEASQKGKSQAETMLADSAAEARQFVSDMKSVAKVLDAVAKVAGTVTKLLNFFP